MSPRSYRVVSKTLKINAGLVKSIVRNTIFTNKILICEIKAIRGRIAAVHGSDRTREVVKCI
jgi:hypothetical protein